MKEINDIILIHYAEGILDKDLSKKVSQAISTDNNLKTKVQMYKKTIDILKKFGKSFELKRKMPKKQELPSNIVKIADYSKNIKKTA